MIRLGTTACLLLVALGGALLLLSCRPGILSRLIGICRGSMPVGILPGPPREVDVRWVLTTDNSVLMSGRNDPQNERWADIQGNLYHREFASRFRYTTHPVVRVRIEPEGVTLQGRIEARGLKPNFCYQIKLAGDFREDRQSFEVIGMAGRWRLPGTATNFSDNEYRSAEESVKARSEAYLFFDYFVTDSTGSACRNFSLDSSLHVIWSATRQEKTRAEDCLTFTVDASDPAIYLYPRSVPGCEVLWAERERVRYRSAEEIIRLPPGSYRARLELTEESFHSQEQGGGWWATVMTLPVTFTIHRALETTNIPAEIVP